MVGDWRRAVIGEETSRAIIEMDYKKNNMSTDRGKGRGNKRARATRGSRNPRHGKGKH
jgi:hypothetical protein